MKRILALMMALAMAVSFAACSAPEAAKTETPAADASKAPDAPAADAKEEAKPEAGKKYSLKVSGIDGSLTMLPVWIAEKQGKFEEAGLTIERSGFTNGPVQMEAIDTWDIGLTGVGGVLSGSINYDAILIATVGTDDGTQFLFAKKDSKVAAAGKGKNTNNPEILGDAESWKGMKVNCTNGNVLHYLLLKTLAGFGLTVDDVEVNWMDMPTSNASLIAGEGDAACVSGQVSFAQDKDNFVVASNGDMAGLGLLTNAMANPKALENPETREATKVFLKVFFETVNWINENKPEAEKYLIEWCDYAGSTIDERMSNIYLSVDDYYTLQKNYETLHAKAGDGGDYNEVQEDVLGVLKFFIDCGNYQQGDDAKFLDPKHIDTTLIDELYEQAK